MTENVEGRAKELGWVPKEQFRGDPEKWVDAETFVKRGEEVMPILRAQNKRQQAENTALREELKKTQQLVQDAQDAIKALTETTSKQAIAQVKQQEANLKAALKQAKVDEDVDRELEIQEQLTATREALKEAEKKPEKKEDKQESSTTVDFTKTPEWKAWTEENPWFGVDKRKTALAMGIAQDLRESGETSVGKAFYDKVAEEVKITLGEKTTEKTSKVEGGSSRTTGGVGGGKGKSFADLPKEAQDICNRQASRLVGKGKAFATEADWKNHYVTKYFEE